MKKILLLLSIIYTAGMAGCDRDKAGQPRSRATQKDSTTVKVTFVELGSVSCIPCKAMQPVMKAIAEEYGEQIQVVFHDVWKNAEPGRKYGIRLIPTQVFLDENGVEFSRHEGFYPKEEIDKILQEKGLKKKSASEKKS
jgi:thioredoxin 1